MSFAHYGKRLIKKMLTMSGLLDTTNAPTLPAAIKRLASASRNVEFNTVVDIGASNGAWSAELMKYYPNVNYLLIEAQPLHEAPLKQFCRRHPNAKYVLAAAGAEESEIYFNADDPLGGLASYKPLKGNCIRVPVTTVDLQLKQHELPPPYLLKLDTHGFEIPIFTGASSCLSQASVIIVECYNFKIAPEAILFHEMCTYLERHGFRCMDIFDLLYRPYDSAFWQMDMLFMKADRSEFSYTEYH